MITSCLAPHQNRYCSCHVEDCVKETLGGGHMITSCLALYRIIIALVRWKSGVRRDSWRWAYDHFLSGSLPESLLLLSGGKEGQ